MMRDNFNYRKTASVLVILLVFSSQACAFGGRGGRANSDRMFRKMDSDGSGSISQEEFMGRMDLVFEKMDRNRDGVLSSEEMDENRARAAKFFASMEREKNVSPGERFDGLDLNSDALVSLDEYHENSRSLFFKLDLDQDGRVIRSELDALKEKSFK